MRESVTVTQVLPVVQDLDDDAHPDEQASAAGLVYLSDDEPGCRRVRRGHGFSYHRPDGSLIEGEERQRIADLAIPPAWRDVWICRDPQGHLQATGRDDAGRKQYLYHPVWRQLREATKFHRLGAFADALPRIRGAVDRDLRRHDLTRDRVTAIVVGLLDHTLVRIGNDQYARADGARGLTTLTGAHIEVTGATIAFEFPGKSGQERRVEVSHRRLARQVERTLATPGERVFVYRDGDGSWCDINADVVNSYLREIAGGDVSAKSFRTWGGTVVAAEALRQTGPPDDPSDVDVNILAAIDEVADRLGNTRAVARASYVHPWVTKAYRLGRLLDQWDDDPGQRDHLDRTERAVGRVLRLDLPPSQDPEEVLFRADR